LVLLDELAFFVGDVVEVAVDSWADLYSLRGLGAADVFEFDGEICRVDLDNFDGARLRGWCFGLGWLAVACGEGAGECCDGEK